MIIRGQPLMIWGGGGNFQNEFIFPTNAFHIKKFFLSKTSRLVAEEKKVQRLVAEEKKKFNG